MPHLYRVLLTLLMSTTISTTQGIAVGALAYYIMNDLNISHIEMGILMSLPSISAMIVSMPIGILIDRLGPYAMLAYLLVILASSTLIASYASSSLILALSRILAGVGMSGIWPSCAKAIALDVPVKLAGISTAIYDIGSLIGLSISYMITSYYGNNWREVLLGLAIASIAISLLTATMAFKSRGNRVSKTSSTRSSRVAMGTYISSIRAAELLLITTAFFFAVQPWFFFVTWGFTYLIEEFRVTTTDLWIFTAISLPLGILVSLVSGTLSDRLRGIAGVKTILSSSMAVSAIFLTASILGITPIITLALSIVFFRLAAPMFWLIINRAYTLDEIGRVGGIYMLGVQISSLVSPTMIAFIRETTGSFRYGVIIISSMTALSALLYYLFRRGQRYQSRYY